MMGKRPSLYTLEDTSALAARGHEWNFHQEKTSPHLHGLHPYPAKFIPQIPRKAIRKWTRKGALVYDPFCGCGTTLLEASLLDRPSVGTDNNPVGILVSRAKTAPYSSRDIASISDFAEALETVHFDAKPRPDLIPDNKNLPYWFGPKVLARLAAIRGRILEHPERARTMLLAAFSSIIVRVSYQDSDTRYARQERATRPTDVDKALKSKLRDILNRMKELNGLARSRAEIHQADARDVPMISDKSVSLIVTSPPYLNAYDYHKYHRQRIHLIGGNVSFARDLEIGSHDEFTRKNAKPGPFFADMDSCFSEWSRVLRRGGRCLIVVGDAIVNKQPVQVADTFVEMLGKRGLRLEDRWIRELQATKRSFNLKNSRISHEHVLLFRKS